LARNQDNVSEWGNMSIRGLLFQWPSTIKIQLSVLVKYKVDLIIISLKINLFSPWYSWKIAELALSINQSLTGNKIDSMYFKWDNNTLDMLMMYMYYVSTFFATYAFNLYI
jgi:hypothetical protein